MASATLEPNQVQQELIGMDQLDRDQLADLAEQANGAHKACEQAARSMLSHARDCGDVLNRAKGYFPHGEWEGWLAENCQFSAGQARRYMRIARSWPELSKRARATDLKLEDLSMREAIRVLTSGEEGDTPPKEKSGPSIFVDMFCPSCGSQLVKTSSLYVTCAECWECRLYPNPDRKEQAEKTAPIVLAFQQWRKMPAADRESFLDQVDPNRKAHDSSSRTLRQIRRDRERIERRVRCSRAREPSDLRELVAFINDLRDIVDKAKQLEDEAESYRIAADMDLVIVTDFFQQKKQELEAAKKQDESPELIEA